jgi:hypothetical protein
MMYRIKKKNKQSLVAAAKEIWGLPCVSVSMGIGVPVCASPITATVPVELTFDWRLIEETLISININLQRNK